MPVGSYMKPRRMVTGCVNKQGQEIVSYFLESEPLPGDKTAGFHSRRLLDPEAGRIRSPGIVSSLSFHFLVSLVQ